MIEPKRTVAKERDAEAIKKDRSGSNRREQRPSNLSKQRMKQPKEDRG
jgi:hypothetical protein